FPIILRISGSERSDQGNTLEDMKNLVPELTAHGIDAFEISGGTQYEQCNKIIPCHGEHQGLNVKEAKAIKKIASVPVIVVGKITDPDYAMQLVDNGLIDGVVLGRALLSDPDFVHKAEAGAFDSIAPCAACGIGCVGEQTKRRPASCVINPALGREKELVLRKTEKPKKAVVVGGGIGGMAAARALGLCGHQVTLFEQSDRLGGQMNVACIPPHKQEVSRWIIYLKKELEACGVSVHLNTEATAETLKAMAPELLIIASGAKEIVPPIKGVEKETAITAQMVLKNDTVIAGGNILVVGGGMVGCEVAETLIHQKRGPMAVTIIEMADEIGEGMVPNNKEPMLRRLKSLGVGLETGTKLEAVEGTDVTVNQRGEVKTLKGFTHIIYACGSKAENNLYTALEKTFPKVVCIGDANGPRQALEAVREGFEAAMTL
ncbi:MAG: FAD-dependent oxidoreductase, partial [Eubacterium sp.]